MQIAILQTAYLGDVILTTPLIQALQRAHPGAVIHFITTPVGAQALQGFENVVPHVYDKRKVSFIQGIKELHLTLHLSVRRFDLVIAVHRSFRSSLIARVLRAKRRVGFATFINKLFGFETVPYAPYAEETHYVDRVLALARRILPGQADLRRTPLLHLSRESEGSVSRKLGAFAAQSFCLISPFSAWGTKMWLADRFAALAVRVGRETGMPVVLCGDGDARSAREGEELYQKIQNSGVVCVNLIGKTAVGELIALVARARLLIANDSAPVHVAAAFNVPTVAIFGPTVQKFGFFPLADKAQIVQKEISCRPCSLHGPKTCPKKHFRCMREIQVEDVFKAVQSVG